MGDLVPVLALDCVPGDKFNISAESLVRFAPMVAPVMHRFDVSIHYFFVPNRIIWDNWEKFITNTKLVSGNIPAPPFVRVGYSEYASSPLPDYLGLPIPQNGLSEKVSALPFAAYQKIYNDYYRDQNLVADLNINLNDGENAITPSLWHLRKRAWEHDYFTSCLPFAQKGEAVSIPLGEIALKPDWNTNPEYPHYVGQDGATHAGTPQNQDFPDDRIVINPATDGQAHAYDPAGSLETEATTINDLRRAFRLQEWLEKAARGGTRYIEFIRSMFGVNSSDKRLQRPEYITGVKSPVQISEVLNTTGTDDLPQGNMAGHAVSVTTGKFGSYFCEEHGYIIGIMSVMPKTAYQQGIPKHFLRLNDPFEYYWPEFANIGEQAVQNKELYAYTATGEDTFGYIPRYAEYKFVNNSVAGDFRTNLNHWHAGRIFSTQPALNSDFINCTPTDRIFAVEDPEIDKLYCHVLNKITAVRPMPKYGTPSF